MNSCIRVPFSSFSFFLNSIIIAIIDFFHVQFNNNHTYIFFSFFQFQSSQNSGVFVIYWPSTEPSIKRFTSVNKRKNSASRWTLKNDITRCTDGSSHWRQDAEVRASGRQRAFGPQWTTFEKPHARWRICAAMVRKIWVNIAVCSRLKLTSHRQQTSPFRE